MDFTNCTEKKKEKVFTQMGWIWAAAACTGRGLGEGRNWAGPASQLHARRGHVVGGFMKIHLRAGEVVTAEAVST